MISPFSASLRVNRGSSESCASALCFSALLCFCPVWEEVGRKENLKSFFQSLYFTASAAWLRRAETQTKESANPLSLRSLLSVPLFQVCWIQGHSFQLLLGCETASALMPLTHLCSFLSSWILTSLHLPTIFTAHVMTSELLRSLQRSAWDPLVHQVYLCITFIGPSVSHYQAKTSVFHTHTIHSQCVSLSNQSALHYIKHWWRFSRVDERKLNRKQNKKIRFKKRQLKV